MGDERELPVAAQRSLLIAHRCPWWGNFEICLKERKSWLRRRVETALTTGFNRAYTTVRVDPDKFLLQLRAGYRVPISGYHGVFSLEIHELDVVAESIIRGGMKMAAVEGAGFGLGGLITIVPDLGSVVGDHDADGAEAVAALWISIQHR